MQDWFKTYSFTVPANGIYRLDAYNNYLAILSNSETTAVKVAIGAGVARAELAAGIGIELPQGEHFKYLNFQNDIGNDMDIVLALSIGKVWDNRLTINNSSLDLILGELRGDMAHESGGVEEIVGNGVAVQMIASNVDRKGCIIQSKSANAGIVYLYFDNTVATNKWFAELQPGQAFSVDNYRGDIYAIASIAGQLVGYGEW